MKKEYHGIGGFAADLIAATFLMGTLVGAMILA